MEPTFVGAERANERAVAVGPDTPKIHVELDNLHGAIDGLDSLLMELVQRANPVLEPGDRISPEREPEPGHLSPVASRIQSQRLRIVDLQERVQAVISRFEV